MLIAGRERYEHVMANANYYLSIGSSFETVPLALESADSKVTELSFDEFLALVSYDEFIETAIRVLTKSNKDTAGDLIRIFPDMRYPYAQAMVLVVLGYKADETHIPWLMDQYKKLKRLYPDESHCEGAFYALFEMQSRFYPPTGKTRKK